MSIPSRPLAAIALFLALSGASLAEPPSAAAVIAAAKAASGGAAWDRLAGVAERGTHAGMPYRTWLSFTGYGMRMENGEGAARRVQGFNGRVAWRAQGDGAAAATQDPAMLREAITTDFVSNNGYFFPARFPATSRWLREDAAAGRRFDVVEITPPGRAGRRILVRPGEPPAHAGRRPDGNATGQRGGFRFPAHRRRAGRLPPRRADDGRNDRRRGPGRIGRLWSGRSGDVRSAPGAVAAALSCGQARFHLCATRRGA
jgi:hypothetical protein